MRFYILFVLLISFISVGQEMPPLFGSEIMCYYGIGHTINKSPNLVIVDSKGVKIEENDSSFQIRNGGYTEHYVTTAFIFKGDTIHPQRYNYKFISLPDPKIRWKAIDQFRIDENTIGLHRDSLDYIKEFEVHHFVTNIPELEWEVVHGTMFVKELKGRPTTFSSGNLLPDSFIDSLKTLGDSIVVSMILNVRGDDGITRQIGGSILLIKMDGVKYDYHRDRLYFYKRYVDTLQISKEQLFSDDTLTLNNPGRLYLELPRLDRDYWFKWHNGNEYCYEVPRVKVEAGEGFKIVDNGILGGEFELQITFDEKPYTIDQESLDIASTEVLKKKVFFTYPNP